MTDWTRPAAGDGIRQYILEVVQRMQEDRRYGPNELWLPSSVIEAMGGNPEDYPLLEGHDDVRKVEMK